MVQISQSDFENWKSDHVTKSFMLAAQERIMDAMEILSVQAGINTEQDNYVRGLIQAYREMQAFRIDDLQEAVE